MKTNKLINNQINNWKKKKTMNDFNNLIKKKKSHHQLKKPHLANKRSKRSLLTSNLNNLNNKMIWMKKKTRPKCIAMTTTCSSPKEILTKTRLDKKLLLNLSSKMPKTKAMMKMRLMLMLMMLHRITLLRKMKNLMRMK